MKYYLLFLFICILTLNSCKETTMPQVVVEKQDNYIDYRSNQGFDSVCALLLSKYPYEQYFSNMGLNEQPPRPLRQTYQLDERLYVPNVKNLTFEYRSSAFSSLDQICLINIYNDTFQFVLPLTDIHYYDVEKIYKKKNGEPMVVNPHNLNLGVELTKLIHLLGENEKYVLIDIIMRFRRASFLSSEFALERYKTEMNVLKKYAKKGFFNAEKCLCDLEENLAKVKYWSKQENAIMYYYGAYVYIFICEEDEIKVEFLNANCHQETNTFPFNTRLWF